MANIKVLVADASHEKYVDTILDTIRTAAKKRGTGIAERTHEYVATKMKEGKAILAVDTISSLVLAISRLGVISHTSQPLVLLFTLTILVWVLQSVSRTIHLLWRVSVGLMQRYSLLQVEML